MNRRSSLVHRLTVGALLVCSTAALAHGPTPQKAQESIHIDAPPAEVWQIVGDVSALADWQPALSAVHPSKNHDGIADETGAERVLVFADGGGEIDIEALDPAREAGHGVGGKGAVERDLVPFGMGRDGGKGGERGRKQKALGCHGVAPCWMVCFLGIGRMRDVISKSRRAGGGAIQIRIIIEL